MGREGAAQGITNHASAQGTPAEKAATTGRLYGLMADAGRVPEDPSYYRRAIDFCREWNMNAYLISLADDQGRAIRFKSHPELITHKNALTHDQARDLARYAQERGVKLIPSATRTTSPQCRNTRTWRTLSRAGAAISPPCVRWLRKL